MALERKVIMSKVTQEQADHVGISLEELNKLAEGKSCKEGGSGRLHVRRTRGGNVTVFNISESARSAKISATKQAKKAAKEAAAGTSTPVVETSVNV